MNWFQIPLNSGIDVTKLSNQAGIIEYHQGAMQVDVVKILNQLGRYTVQVPVIDGLSNTIGYNFVTKKATFAHLMEKAAIQVNFEDGTVIQVGYQEAMNQFINKGACYESKPSVGSEESRPSVRKSSWINRFSIQLFNYFTRERRNRL